MRPSTLYICYVKRFDLANPSAILQVLAGTSFDENQILEWIEEGREVDHAIWYEELPIVYTSDRGGPPKELRVYFDSAFGNVEGWDKDFQWIDPVGRKAIALEDYEGLERPQPEIGDAQTEYDYFSGAGMWWRVPCPWNSLYLLTPFTETSKQALFYGEPWSV